MAKRKFLKNGLVAATESKWTGEELTWHDVDTWTDEKKKQTFSRALNFYNYYLNMDDYVPIIEDYLKSMDRPSTKATVKMIRKAPKCIEIVSCGKLARMMNLGMPKYHNGVDYGVAVDIYLRKISTLVPIERNKTKKDERKKVSVYDLMQDRIREGVLVRMDEMLDGWILNTTAKVFKINVGSLLKSVNAPISSLGTVVTWIDKQRDELIEARDKSNPDSVEGYSYLKKAAIKKRIALLEEMLNDVEIYKSTKKAARKPRKTKERSADKLVAKMNYLKSSPDYGVASVNPIKVVGSIKVYLFNEKYRKLTILSTTSLSGLSVKGTTIRDYDEKNSFSMKIRKPEEILPIIVSKTDRQIENVLKKLTTKKTSANGRVNDNTLILKA
mgnify:FL=1|tara:strand:- start:4741 stop:5895 length:1155 start_codon:yes stop_codon:yes gene_type:complete